MEIDGLQVKECVGCGHCCITARCVASYRVWPNGKDCPGLEWKDDRYNCKLASLPGELGIRYRAELYIGDGCCQGLNSWRQNVKPRRDIDLQTSLEMVKLDKAFIAFLHAFGSGFTSGDAISLAILGMAHRLKKWGVEEEKVLAISKEVSYHLRQCRMRGIDVFMGEIDEIL
jgi:hypothetical protein